MRPPLKKMTKRQRYLLERSQKPKGKGTRRMLALRAGRAGIGAKAWSVLGHLFARSREQS